MQKRIEVSVFKAIKISNLGRKRIEYHFSKKESKPRAEEDRSVILQEPFRTSDGRGTKPFPNLMRKRKGMLLQNLVLKKKSHKIIKNSKSHAEEGQSINS